MILGLIAAAGVAAAPPPFVERRCEQPLVGKARCGTVEVPENRGASGGRTIRLRVIVIPSTNAPTLPPLFDFAGGPGLASTGSVDFYLSDGAAYHARRDIVLVDQRGTGASHALNCPEFDAEDKRYRPMFAAADVEHCRRTLAATADLRFYGTDQTVADLDAVRSALGHERIDILALSYGTTLALRYLAVHPTRVRAAVLMGVVPSSAMPPAHHAPAAERAFRLLFADCAADSKCRAAYPDPAGDFAQALRRLPEVGAISRSIFAEKLRTLTYGPEGARRIPMIVHRATLGDFGPFRDATNGKGLPYANGTYLSVTCTESLAPMSYRAAAVAARKTPFGDYRLRRQREACANWPVGKVAPGFFKAPRTDAAVLLLSGRLDPVAPPEWAQAVAAHLPNSRHVILPDGGHIFDGLSGMDSCFDPVILRFYDNLRPKALDVSCFATMRAPPFAIE